MRSRRFFGWFCFVIFTCLPVDRAFERTSQRRTGDEVTIYRLQPSDKPQKSSKASNTSGDGISLLGYSLARKGVVVFERLEEIFLEWNFRRVAVPFLLIIRLLCLFSPISPELLLERNHHPCGVGLVGRS